MGRGEERGRGRRAGGRGRREGGRGGGKEGRREGEEGGRERKEGGRGRREWREGREDREGRGGENGNSLFRNNMATICTVFIGTLSLRTHKILEQKIFCTCVGCGLHWL